MIAGTIARLTTPADDPLESWYSDNGPKMPALYVSATQTGLGEHRPIQRGKAAGRVEISEQMATVATKDGELQTILSEHEPVMTEVVTEWVADVTDTGLLAAESVVGEDPYAFPFDLLANRTGSDVELLEFDIEAIHRGWAREGTLRDVWMAGSSEEDDDEDGEGKSTNIQYHDAADVDDEPTFGLGFVRAYDGTVERGVVFESGYVAVYNASSASEFVNFVADCLIPFASAKVDEEQQFLSEIADDGSDDFADEVADSLDEEGVDYEQDVEVEAEAILEDIETEDLERDDGDLVCSEEGCTNVEDVSMTNVGPLCPICRDRREEDGEIIHDVDEGEGGSS